MAAGVSTWRRAQPASGRPPHLNLLRSYVFCAICGRRMFGRTSHETSSFACPPQSKTGAPGHQSAISVRQDALLDGLRLFLRDHLLGPNRTTLLTETLSRTAHEADTR